MLSVRSGGGEVEQPQDLLSSVVSLDLDVPVSPPRETSFFVAHRRSIWMALSSSDLSVVRVIWWGNRGTR